MPEPARAKASLTPSGEYAGQVSSVAELVIRVSAPPDVAIE